MTKIAIVGAGGVVFPLRLVGDLLAFPELRGAELALMDIDEPRLRRTADAARDLVAHHGLPTRVTATTDLGRALDGADHVMVTFQVGGLEAYRHDVEIPRRYGVDQTVGDTLGPGGVFRFLRSVPAFRRLAAEMATRCPDALLINYANPMAMSCWLLDRLGVRAVGLCHSVQGTSRMLARALDVPYGEVDFLAAGINHQSWFLRLRRGEEDLYPRLRESMVRRHLRRAAGSLDTPRADEGDHTEADRGDSDYEGGDERVRTEIMAAYGYFHTESSHHASEYVPYFRKTAAQAREVIPRRWDYYQVCASTDGGARTAELLARLKAALTPSVEYGAVIVDAVETGRPAVVYGNVPNRSLIPNLPDGCCVEVPCLVDRSGVQPTVVGPLPPQCAALNRTNVNVQELAIAAALTEDVEHVYQAVSLDPLTGAVLTLGQIRAMVDELRLAEAGWLPAFAQPAASAAGPPPSYCPPTSRDRPLESR